VVWVDLPGEVDTFDLARRALPEAVSVAPGRIFSATRKYGNHLRPSCARAWDGRVAQALALVAKMLS
jgi:DNA-binding transcriptional MocR family regulator